MPTASCLRRNCTAALTLQSSGWIILLESYHVDTPFNFVWVRVRHVTEWRVHVNVTAVLTLKAETFQVRAYSIYTITGTTDMNSEV